MFETTDPNSFPLKINVIPPKSSEPPLPSPLPHSEAKINDWSISIWELFTISDCYFPHAIHAQFTRDSRVSCHASRIYNVMLKSNFNGHHGMVWKECNYVTRKEKKPYTYNVLLSSQWKHRNLDVRSTLSGLVCLSWNLFPYWKYSFVPVQWKMLLICRLYYKHLLLSDIAGFTQRMNSTWQSLQYSLS